MPIAIRQYHVQLRGVQTMDAFSAAFNEGLIHKAGGHWEGNNWDAFHDYLSWPVEESYVLVLDGWASCSALNDSDRAIFEEVLADNPHVSVSRT
jgi:hypothetical protein